MNKLTIILFCLVAGVALGNIAGTSMSMALAIDSPVGPYIGAVMGGMLGLFLSPLFMLRRVRGNVFEMLVLCFSLAFPVALSSGLTGRPWLSIGLTLATTLSVYILSLKKTHDAVSLGWLSIVNTRPLILPCAFICMLFQKQRWKIKCCPMMCRLVELIGDNNLSVHTADARKFTFQHSTETLLGALIIRILTAEWCSAAGGLLQIHRLRIL